MCTDSSSSPRPIFAASYEMWRERYVQAVVDARAFDRLVRRCDLASCRGMCCYDGVYVDGPTKTALNELVRERRDELGDLGAAVTGEVVVEARWRDQIQGYKTATRPFDFRSKVADFPAHFEQTACVFHLDDGRCALQVLAERDGRHSWDYKPPTCWLHPVDLSDKEITLYDEETDPYLLPDYPGYASQTICGRTEPCGRPAREVFAEELAYLGMMLNRDLSPEFKSLREE